MTTAQTAADNPVEDGQPPAPPTTPASRQHHRRVPQLTTPASHQHHRRPRPATNTTDVVPQPTTPASHQHHRPPSHPQENSQWEWFNHSMQSAAYPVSGAKTQVALSVRCTKKTCRPPLLLSSTLTISFHLRGQTSLTESDGDNELILPLQTSSCCVPVMCNLWSPFY